MGYTRAEFAEWADNEGGIVELVLGHGIDLDSDLPDNDEEFRSAILDLINIAGPVIERANSLLPDFY